MKKKRVIQTKNVKLWRLLDSMAWAIPLGFLLLMIFGNYDAWKQEVDAVQANTELTNALQRFTVVSESYPELKANANFMQLQNELSATEDKIAKARQFYNDTVLKYNNAVEMIPANLVAGLFGHRKLSFLEASGEERKNVKIQAEQFRM